MNFKRLLLPAVLLAVGLFATWLRFDVVESTTFAHSCQRPGALGACLVRGWVVQGFLLHLPGASALNFYGVAALLATLWALLSSRPGVALLAAALGLLALQLYSAEPGALALLAGLLRLLHLQASALAETPGLQPNRERQ